MSELPPDPGAKSATDDDPETRKAPQLRGFSLEGDVQARACRP